MTVQVFGYFSAEMQWAVAPLRLYFRTASSRSQHLFRSLSVRSQRTASCNSVNVQTWTNVFPALCLYTRYPVATGGLYPPPGSRPFHILHFPFSLLIGRVAIPATRLLCSCDVLEEVKQREFGRTRFIDGSDLKQRSGPLRLHRQLFSFFSLP